MNHSTRSALTWTGAAVAAAAVTSVTSLYLANNNTSPQPNQLTVGETVNDMVEQHQTGTDAKNSNDPANAPKVVRDILGSLGLPASMLGEFGVDSQTDTANRNDLAARLDDAVSQGVLTSEEAEAVLKAVELGIVSNSRGEVLLEENPGMA